MDKFTINDKEYTLGELLLSPTRCMVLPIKALFENGIFPKYIIHNTGGGMCKINRFIQQDYAEVKLYEQPMPFIFKIMRKFLSIYELENVFNCGRLMELIFESDDSVICDVKQIVQGYNVPISYEGRINF